MLASVERHQLHDAQPVVAFDLGLLERDRERLARRFAWCRVERFDFAAHPAHVRELSNFAWKPFLLSDLAQRGETILWFDSATLFHGGIDDMLQAVSRDGVYSLAGQSALEDCCDPRTLARLDVAAEDRRERYRAGGVLGFDPSRAEVRELLRRWRDCAADRSLIAPPGADPRRHKFDQAILTALLCRARREQGWRLGSDEIDISSRSPVRWVSTRNKVAPWVPVACDPLVRGYYALWKRADRIVLRLRARRPAGLYPRAYSR